MSFNSGSIRKLRENLDAELTLLSKKLGVHLAIGGTITYNDKIAKIKIEATVIGEGGKIETAEELDFKRHAASFGLKETDLHRTFFEGGKTFTIVGLMPRSHQYPIVVESNGKQYKMSADRVIRGLDSPVSPNARRKLTRGELLED